MNRTILVFILFLLVSAPQILCVDSQIEFTAEITAIDDSGEFTVLTVSITPEVSLNILISDRTEIENRDSGELGPAALQVGQTIKVKGIFTDLGLLALEIKVSAESDSFRLKGPIHSIVAGVIEVLGIRIIVPPEAEIIDSDGPIAFDELEVGQFVEIAGMVVEGQLVARRIKVRRERDRFSPIRFEGIVRELPSDEQMVVELAGAVSVDVVLTPDTEIEGTLAVGVRVRVYGHVGPDLVVVARRVLVLRLLQLVPRRLQMEPSSERRMVVMLGSVFDRDIPVALFSRNPEVARPTSDVAMVPAGHFNAVFQIASGPTEGETEIIAELPEDLGSLQARSHVKVEDEGEPDRELEIRWSPDKIRAAPNGEFAARLHLNRPAPDEFHAVIEQTQGDEDFVVFPEAILFPAGERTVRVPLQFLQRQGEALLKASLPDDLGGDSDQLEIQIRANNDVKIRLKWVPDKLETEIESGVRAILVLDAPASVDFRVVLSIRHGDADLLVGLPAEVEFSQGQAEAVVEFKTGDRPGRVSVRAALPRSLGGDHADLKIEIEN